jgi:hypothetical protein
MRVFSLHLVVVLEISIDAKKRETIWKNPKQNKTKQNKNTTHSLVS